MSRFPSQSYTMVGNGPAGLVHLSLIELISGYHRLIVRSCLRSCGLPYSEALVALRCAVIDEVAVKVAKQKATPLAGLDET